MKRLEIIANQSMREEITDAIEAAVPEYRYTLIPEVQGRGHGDWKLGTTVWPEENFLMVTYLADAEVGLAVAAVAGVKAQHPDEGIKAFTSEASEEV